ncbi:MAG: glutathione S-transferase N-terminal domain-containing protein [Sandaracinus sp.]
MRAPDLALYHYDSCPFCFRVRRALSRLGVEVELRNIHESPEHLRALVEARGAKTVPVLRIRHENGQDEWMPESADIVRYLDQRFGGA